MKHCPSALFIPGVCVQTSKQQYRTSTSKYTCTISHQSETPVTATMSGAKFSRRYEETFFYSGLARGNTHFPRTWCLAGGAPTFRAPQSRPKSTPTSATGFREPPNSRPGLGKLPTRQSMSSLWTPYCLIPNTQLGRVSLYV